MAEFDNVHDEVADLRARVERVEALLKTADQVAHAALAEIEKHETETEQPAVEAEDGETHDDGTEQATG